MAALPFRPLPAGACLYKASLCSPAPQPSLGRRSSWIQAYAHTPEPSTVILFYSGPPLGIKRAGKGPPGAELVRGHAASAQWLLA